MKDITTTPPIPDIQQVDAPIPTTEQATKQSYDNAIMGVLSRIESCMIAEQGRSPSFRVWEFDLGAGGRTKIDFDLRPDRWVIWTRKPITSTDTLRIIPGADVPNLNAVEMIGGNRVIIPGLTSEIAFHNISAVNTLHIFAVAVSVVDFDIEQLFTGYARKVISTVGNSLIGFWPQWEDSDNISYDQSPENNDGQYTGVTLGQPGVPGMGYTCPQFDGLNDYNDIISVAPDFNGAEGTLIMWPQVAGAGDWIDGVIRYMVRLRVDGNNYVMIRKPVAINQLEYYYTAGGVVKVRGAVTNSTDFLCCALTWSGSSDEVNVYLNGARIGLVLNGLGVWVGALAAGVTCIGAVSTAPLQVWNGHIGPVVLCNEAHPIETIAYLSEP